MLTHALVILFGLVLLGTPLLLIYNTYWGPRLSNEPVYDSRRLTQLAMASHFSLQDQKALEGRVSFEAFPKKERLFYKKLEAQVDIFKTQVWEAGLQKDVDACRFKGMEGRVSSTIEILCYSMAGRTMTTIREGDHDVTVMSAADEVDSRMGLHGINGTLRQGMSLLARACEVWKQRGIKMVVEKSVTIGR